MLTLHAHEKDLGGGFVVRRLLPAAARRAVGPWIFFDHFGPVTVRPEDQHDVRPHPHIGLATVTWLFDGAMQHRDSLGSVQRIEPGALNWMTAGRGIVHSERRPADLADRVFTNHGLQLWVALPRAHEEDAPAFHHHAADALPALSEGGATLRLMIGEGLGLRSPVVTPMQTLYLDLTLSPGARFVLPWLAPELAIYPVQGELGLDGQAALPLHRMAVPQDGQRLALQATGAAPARLVVVGGEPLDGPRHLWWNFVASRKERLLQAADDWAAGRFPPVPGETDFIPLPERRPLQG